MWGSSVWGQMIWGTAVPVPALGPLGLLVLAGLLLAMATASLHRRQSAWVTSLFVVLLVVPLSAYAGSVALPNLLVNGTIADADAVNANFDAVKSAVDDNDARLTGVESTFGVNTSFAVGGSGDTCTLGEVWLTAGSVGSGALAQGQLLLISQNPSLFSLLGTIYGGDGQSTFALPDLRDAAPSGLTYVICVNGIFPVQS